MPLARLIIAAILLAPAPAFAQRVLGDDAAACLGGAGPAIRVKVNGLKDRTGRLKLELYPDNADDFLKDDTVLHREGKFFHRIWAQTPVDGAVVMCIRAPRPGRYALLLTHDRDGRNKFDFWNDGAGFPSDRKLRRSRPTLNDALLRAGGGVTRVTIRLQYMQGLIAGFAPIEQD